MMNVAMEKEPSTKLSNNKNDLVEKKGKADLVEKKGKNKKLTDFFTTPDKTIEKQKQKSLLSFFTKSASKEKLAEENKDVDSVPTLDDVTLVNGTNDEGATTPNNSDKENSEIVVVEDLTVNNNETVTKSKKKQLFPSKSGNGEKGKVENIGKKKALKDTDSADAKKNKKAKKKDIKKSAKDKLSESAKDKLSDSWVVVSDSNGEASQTDNDDSKALSEAVSESQIEDKSEKSAETLKVNKVDDIKEDNDSAPSGTNADTRTKKSTNTNENTKSIPKSEDTEAKPIEIEDEIDVITTDHKDEVSKCKKTALKGKDMLNLLKEIQSTDVSGSAKKKKHKKKHKHKHKNKTEVEVHELANSDENEGSKSKNTSDKESEKDGPSNKESKDNNEEPLNDMPVKRNSRRTTSKIDSIVEGKAIVEKKSKSETLSDINETNDSPSLETETKDTGSFETNEKMESKSASTKEISKNKSKSTAKKEKSKNKVKSATPFKKSTKDSNSKAESMDNDEKNESNDTPNKEMSYSEYLEMMNNRDENDEEDNDNDYKKLNADNDQEAMECNEIVVDDEANDEVDSIEVDGKEEDSKTVLSDTIKDKIGLSKIMTSTPDRTKKKANKNAKMSKQTDCKVKPDARENSKDNDEIVITKEFLAKKDNVRNMTSLNGKSKQATLSFGKSGLTVSKPLPKVEETAENTKSEDKTKTIAAGVGYKDVSSKMAKKKNIKNRKSRIVTVDLNTTDSSVFATPEPSRKKKVKRKIETSSEADSESADSLDRRRSSRKRYKVEAFQMDADNKTPIKIKLKCCPKSSSSGEEFDRPVVVKKPKTNIKQTAALALLDKAKRGKMKKLKKQKEGKTEKVKEKKKRRTQIDSNSSEDSATRRSSRLEGRVMASMEEVSLENIVISSDDNDDIDGDEMVKVKKRGRPKKAPITDLREVLNKKSAKGSASTPVSTPTKERVKKTATPVKNSPKKGMKLAPMFMKGKNKVAEASPKKPVLDPEQQKQRQQFLMSGVPEALKKQTAVRMASIVDADYPPFPKPNHILQIPDACDRAELGLCNVWDLKMVELKLRGYDVSQPVSARARFTGDLMNSYQSTQNDLKHFKNFKSHEALSTTTVNNCLKEIQSYNPSYPSQTMYKALVEMKTECDKPTVKTGCSMLWTEKYCPLQSSEILGNMAVMKKLKAWLTEWKHVLDREARKARKLLMRKNKGKQKSKKDVDDDVWDDDSDFDMDSEDSDDDDSLCNTMLLSGPHGCGKTSSIYALAVELGFKVHEVNTSSCRSGKQILSQLQEATQSHQVSTHGSLTPKKRLGSTDQPAKENKLMPKSFTNLFQKAAQNSQDKAADKSKEKDDSKDGGKKRKRQKSDKDDGSKSKKKRESLTREPVQLVMEDSNSQSATNCLNLSSTTLILFDEVDVVFEEDKGFLTAIQNFMSKTKIPIILTTADTGFNDNFDGRYETMNLKRPTMASITSHLQTISLVENVRLDSNALSELVQLYNCDVRKCLTALQFILLSGGDQYCTSKTFKISSNTSKTALDSGSVQSNCIADSNVVNKPVSVTNGDDNSRDANNSDDDFVAIKPLKKRRRVIEEDSNSMDSSHFSVVKSQDVVKTRDVATVEKNELDSTECSLVHCIGVDTMLKNGNLTVMDILTRGLKSTSSLDLKEMICTNCCVHQTTKSDLFFDNLHLFLPFSYKIVDSVYKTTENITTDSTCSKKPRKRIKMNSDLYDSEASNDVPGLDPETNVTESEIDESKTQETKDSAKKEGVSSKAENRCLIESLSSFTRLYDTLSSLDVLESCEKIKIVDNMQSTNGLGLSGNLVPGVENLSQNHKRFCETDLEVCQAYSSEIEARSMCKFYKETESIKQNVDKLSGTNSEFGEHFVLPVRKDWEQFSLVDRSGVSVTGDYKRACGNVRDQLPLSVHTHQRNQHLDYLPSLREISRFEQCRQITNTKRRFHHYFDGITLSLKEKTITTLATTFI